MSGPFSTPLRGTTNALSRDASKLREKDVDTLTRITNLITRRVSRSETSIGVSSSQVPLASLSPTVLKDGLKGADFLMPTWDESRAQLHHTQDEWEANEDSAPIFPFGYHWGIWYKLQPCSDVMQADFIIRTDTNRHKGLYPASSSDWGMSHLEYYTFSPVGPLRTETHGFNCVGLGQLSWAKGNVNSTETQLQQSNWYASPMAVVAEVLEDGTAGPIWAIRSEAGELEEDNKRFNTATGFGTMTLAKIGNSIDEMSRSEWSSFEGTQYCSRYRTFALYQSRERGPLRFVRGSDEKMKTDSEGEQKSEHPGSSP